MSFLDHCLPGEVRGREFTNQGSLPCCVTRCFLYSRLDESVKLSALITVKRRRPREQGPLGGQMEPTAKGDEAQACPDPLSPLGLEGPPPSTPIITGEAMCLTGRGHPPSFTRGASWQLPWVCSRCCPEPKHLYTDSATLPLPWRILKGFACHLRPCPCRPHSRIWA